MSKPSTVSAVAAVVAVVAKAAPLAHISAKPIEGKVGQYDTTREDKIRAAFKVIHHETLLGCAEVGTPVQFNDNFFSCGTDDLKVCHQQARALISAAEKARWETYSSGLVAAIAPIVQAAQAMAREDKAAWDALAPRLQARAPWVNVVEIPATDLKAAFPEGTEDAHILADLHKLFGKRVVNGGNKADKSVFGDFFLTCAFEATAPKAEDPPAAESAPASAEVKAA